MRTAIILTALSLVTTAYTAVAESVPEGIAPDGKAPADCESNSKSNFTIGYSLLSSMKRESALEAKNNALQCTLQDGILKDPQNRVGSVVANYQFQFDGPPQAGAIYTGGFSICKNSSLAIGSSTRWWKCGSGEFYNLYERSIGGQCDEIRIVVTYIDEPSSSSSSSGASSTTSSGSGSASGSSGSSGSSSGSDSASTTPSASSDSSATTTSPGSSGFTSAPATGGATGSASGAANAASASGSPPAPSAAAPGSVRIPRAETFGAVVGIFGAALLL